MTLMRLSVIPVTKDPTLIAGIVKPLAGNIEGDAADLRAERRKQQQK